MADQRFFKKEAPFTLGQLAEMTGSELSDPASSDKVIEDVASLQNAGVSDISFFDNRKYLAQFIASKAGACFTRKEASAHIPMGMVCLFNANPYKAYAIAATAFYPNARLSEYAAPSSFIDPSAKIGAGCYIGHGAVIGANVEIGSNCRIMHNAVIQPGVKMGDDCEIGANAYVTHAELGNRVRLHPGVCVGSPGFGFAIDRDGFTSVPQLGRVIIEDDVDIGANTTIDRGAGPDTIIGRGTRIDNLVQIGHNVKIGKYCVIVSQAGVSGSTELGDFVMAGGQSGIAGHLKIGSGAKIAAQSGIMRDVAPKEEVMGTPAVGLKQFMRQTIALARLIKRGDKT